MKTNYIARICGLILLSVAILVLILGYLSETSTEDKNQISWCFDGNYYSMDLSVYNLDSDCEDVLQSDRMLIGTPSKKLMMMVALLDHDEDSRRVLRLVAESLYEMNNGTERLPEFVAAFVQQGIGYVSDSEQFGYNEIALKPVETLYFGKGDCEDKAMLFVSLMDQLGYGTGLVILDGHVTSILASDDEYPQLDGYNSIAVYSGLVRYVLIETSDTCPFGYIYNRYHVEDIIDFVVIGFHRFNPQ